MKTKGMEHQLKALRLANGREYYALLMEMGTGKTWTVLADAERCYAAGKIDGLLVVAPKGVHTNWVRREIPKHIDCEYVCAAYSANKTKRYQKTIDNLYRQRDINTPPPLRIFAINIDAVNTAAGFAEAAKFLRSTKTMMVVDESSRIKNPKSKRTTRVMNLGKMSKMRRICSGLPVTNSPPDIFMQMEFLSPGLLGTTSYRAFMAEYADLIPETSNLIKDIQNRIAASGRGFVPSPQIVRRTSDGTPMWRNLDKLAALIEPHAFRILKKECLDLPEKIYTTTQFELTPSLRRHYDRLREELRIQLAESITPVAALAAIKKFQQITSGFVMLNGQTHLLAPGENPRMEVLKEAIEDIDGKFIIWALFREEIAQIAEMLEAEGVKVVQYHGGVKDKDRETAIDEFQNGEARAFVGTASAGGIGLTLTAASTVIYYSNDYNLDHRLQSEDRAHRIGTKNPVVYIDIVAVNTIDEKVAAVLQAKEDTNAIIMGDKALDFVTSVGDN